MMKSKKGTATVLICLFFVTLMSLISAYIGAAKATALSSAVKSLGSLWGESVMAEYDLNLYNRYGLFGFYGQPVDVTDRLDFYAIRSACAAAVPLRQLSAPFPWIRLFH